MKTKHNILTKIFLILLLAAGWGSTAWAERFEPAFVASYSPTSTSWYYFKFENSNAFLYSKATGENFSFKANETQNPAFMWQLVGTSAEFRLVSLTGQYAYWKGSELSGTDDASQAATFKLIDGSDADSYSVQKSEASGTSDCLNPQSPVVRTFNRDGGCRVRFSAPTSADLAAAQEAITVYELHNVNLVFKDAAGNTLTGASVTYSPANGNPAVTLDATQSPYDFGGVVYSQTLFSGTSGYTFGKVTYDEANNALTFILSPHVLPTGVYRMVASRDDRGFFIDNENYIGVAKNRHKTGWAAPTVANSLWYVCKGSGNKYYISSLSSYPSREAEHIAFLKGTGNGTSFVLDNPTTWIIDYYATAPRFGTNQSGYDTTIPKPDYFTVQLSNDNLLTSTPGYDGAGSCRLKTYEAGASDIEFQPYSESLITDPDQLALLVRTKALWATVPLDGAVNLRFVDENGAPTTVSGVTYHPSDGSADVVILADATSYTFINEQFAEFLAGNLFTVNASGYALHTTYDAGTKTLTFVVYNNINELLYSSAPQNGQWAPDTKWFTLRSTQSTGFINTAEDYTDEERDLKLDNTHDPIAAHERGGAWCAVQLSITTCQIYNAAYGPDFVLGVSGSTGNNARVQMYPKDKVPADVVTTFMIWENENKLTGTNNAYSILSNGKGFLYSQGNYTVTNGGSGDDINSSFTFTRIPNSVINSWPEYDVYKVEHHHAISTNDITYHDASKVHGKRNTANNGDFLIVNHGSGTELTNFDIANSTEFEIESVSTADAAGHYYKRLIFEVNDLLATEVYTIYIIDKTKEQNLDVSNVGIEYINRPHHDGETFKTRPDVPPASIDFIVDDNALLQDKFIWGPVINKEAQTVTFVIRSLAEELTEGWYMFQVENASDVATINSRINYYPGNYNEVSRLQYLMESCYGKCKMKFSGVGGYDERYAYIYLSKNGQYINLRGDSHTSEFAGLSYTFANGRLTLTGCSVDPTTLEPIEMPALRTTGSGITFRATPINPDLWEVYRVNFDFGGTPAPTPLSAVYTINEATGSSKEVHHNDFLILPHNSSVAATTVSRYAFNTDEDGTPVAQVTDEGIKVSVDGDHDGATNVLTLHLAPTQKKYVVYIKAGEGLSESEKAAVADYKAVVRSTGAEFATTAFDAENHVYSADVYLPSTTDVDATTFKVDNETQFVWGPIVDQNTYTFEIRKAATPVENGKWYQIQLKDEEIPSLINNDKRPRNLVDMVNSQSGLPVYVRNRGSYVYAVSSRVSDRNYPLELTGMLPEANEKLNYVYVGSDGKIYSQNGSYVGINGTNSGDALTFTSTSDANNYFSWSNIGAVSNSGSAPYITLGWWTGIGAGPLHLHFHESPVTDIYDVYQIHFTDASLVKKADYIGTEAVHGQMLNDLVENAFLFINKNTWQLTTSPSNQRKAPITKADLEAKLAHEFKALGYKTITVTVGDKAADGITPITLEVTDELTDMILHRQHAVYDNYYATAASERPADEAGYIHGSGWTTNPNTSTAVQRTSTYKVTQYVKQGQNTKCYFPAVSRTGGGAYLDDYMRFYDYTTETAPNASVLTGFSNATKYANKTVYTNGWLTNEVDYFTVNLNGESQQVIGLDCSDFTDKGEVGTNYKEPSLAIRVIYTIRDAKIMADELYKNCRYAVNPEHYYQSNSFIVPNVMRGSADHYDGASLLSLDMPWSNYWAYNTAIDVEGATAEDKDAALQRLIDENANVAVTIPNVIVSVSPNLEEYVEAGVFCDQGGLPGGDNTKYLFANGNHFVAYQLKKEVPDGMKGSVMVRFTAGSITYNIAKFDLEFQANTEPLAITSVVGTESRRWTANLIGPDKEGYEEVAKLTFEQKTKNFKHPNNGNESNFTYGFPLDFDKTSYAYGSDNKYSMYRVTTHGYGYLYYPVSVYEHNILNRASSITSTPNDYFLYIDAAEQPGTVSSIPFEGNLCAGSKLYFSGYVGSSNDGAKSSSGGVIFRLVGIDSGGGRHTLVSYLPGMFSNWAYDTEGNAYNAMVGASVPIKMIYGDSAQNPQFYNTSGTRTGDANKTMIWQHVGFEFMLDSESGFPKYELEVVNNCYSTKGGDYVLDDFRVCAAIPNAEVDFSTPLCEDRVRHIKIHTLYNDLVKATGKSRVNSQAEYDALPEADKTMGVSYCFIDEEKFLDKLVQLNPDPALLTIADYNAAFEYALVGAYTNDRTNPNHAFHNFDVSRYFAGVPVYSFKDSDDDNIYRETKNGADYIVFKESMSHNDAEAVPSNWVVGRKYLILYSTAKVTQAHINAHTVGTSVYQVNGSCYSCKEFTVKSSVTARSDIEYLDFDGMQACSGQTATFSVDMVASKPSGDIVERGLYYDYWIGDAGVDDGAGHYTVARNGSEDDLEKKVLTEEFAKKALVAAGIISVGSPLPSGSSITTDTDGLLHWHEKYTFTETINEDGTVNDITSSPIAKDIDYVITDILRDFRAAFPSATPDNFDLLVGPALAANNSYVFTPSMKAFIKVLITPDPVTGRIPLVLRRQSFDLDLNLNNTVLVPGTPAKRYIYFTAVPIVPLWGTYGNEDVIYCPAPKEFSINLLGDAPYVEDGFAGFPYPADMHNVPIRIGLHQIEKTRLTITEETNDALAPDRSELIVPLRNIAPIYGKDNPVEANRLGGQMIPVDRYITGSTMPYVFLTHTDDPYYTAKIDELIQNSVDNNLSLFPVGRVVSIVDDNYRKTHGVGGHINGMGELHMVFSSDFAPREGYTYTLKVDFLEKTNLAAEQTLPADYVAPCPGSFIFDMKIVPEYQQWTAAAGNDWTNDRNWARADRDVLHADNAASDGTKPLDHYLNNATNYHGDAHYTASDRATAHGFIPMYFTNVLMHDADIVAPDLYKLAKPTKAGAQFLSDLESTASEMAKYDMLVTPVADDGNALDLALRYVDHDGNFGCELFWTNVCNGLTFEPGTMMYDAQHLQYNRVWVEYELDTNRWYTLASPLKNTYAGEWYSPTDGGRQLTPHFYDITYDPALNDRFNPAYYQRSWDKAGEAWIYRMNGDNGQYLGFEHDTQNADVVRVQKPTYLNWSYVYNDVEVPYSNGGFSVNVRYTDATKAPTAGSKALVRMPKADATYKYYENSATAGANGPVHGDESQTLNRTGHYRLMSDALAHDDDPLAPPTVNQFITNRSETNPYFLVGNPFMAPMNMDQFFAEQTCKRRKDATGAYSPDGQPTEESTFVSGKYWILEGTKQNVNIKLGNSWISTDDNADAGVVAPLQGFFVQMPVNSTDQAVLPEPLAGATTGNGVRLAFSANVQQRMDVVIGENEDGSPIYGYSNGEDGQANPIYGHKPSLKTRRRAAAAQPALFRITATNGSELESNAVVYFSDKASNGYNTAEDAETLLDGNIADKVSTVFTAADEQALSINSMSTHVTTIPVGVIAPKDDTRTTLRFSGISQLEAALGGAPHLYDAENDTFQVLDEETVVTVTGTTAGRYFIVSGTNLPFAEEADAEDEADYDGKVYNLHGIRVATPQRGNVTIHGSRKEYTK